MGIEKIATGFTTAATIAAQKVIGNSTSFTKMPPDITAASKVLEALKSSSAQVADTIDLSKLTNTETSALQHKAGELPAVKKVLQFLGNGSNNILNKLKTTQAKF